MNGVCAVAGVAIMAVVACASHANPPTETSGGNGNVSPGGGTSTPQADAGADSSSGAPTSGCGFPTSPDSFALPTIDNAATPAFPQLPFETQAQVSCLSGTSRLSYLLLDMNGDDSPDLVVTSTCDDATIGQTAWLVYLNQGTGGFASSPTHFAIPTPSTTAGCATSSIFDINGDGLPDYVVTSLCSDATVGTSRWLVYPNMQNSFAATSTAYTLPPGASAGAFVSTFATAASCSGGKNAPAFSVFDINGDAMVDFVVTQACSSATVGTSSWLVYLGQATGAAQTPTTFALPSDPTVTSGAFGSTSGTLSCSSTATVPSFTLFDFDADGKLDIVVTQDCADSAIGSTSWLFYRNSGTEFSPTGASITLPTIPQAPTGSFPSLAGTGDCATTGAPSYVLADVTADGRGDMLVWGDCHDNQTGVAYWKVYANSGAGFSSSPAKLALPSALGAKDGSPLGLSSAAQCTVAPPVPAFTTGYLTKVGFDIVATEACADATVGETRWLLFPASCP
jgi:hypothetical protein